MEFVLVFKNAFGEFGFLNGVTTLVLGGYSVMIGHYTPATKQTKSGVYKGTAYLTVAIGQNGIAKQQLMFWSPEKALSLAKNGFFSTELGDFLAETLDEVIGEAYQDKAVAALASIGVKNPTADQIAGVVNALRAKAEPACEEAEAA